MSMAEFFNLDPDKKYDIKSCKNDVKASCVLGQTALDSTYDTGDTAWLCDRSDSGCDCFSEDTAVSPAIHVRLESKLRAKRKKEMSLARAKSSQDIILHTCELRMLLTRLESPEFTKDWAFGMLGVGKRISVLGNRIKKALLVYTL
jgi:hypothetical protein